MIETRQPGRHDHTPGGIIATPVGPVTEAALQDAADTFAMLAAPIRLLIVCQLGRGDRDVSTLATATGRSISAISNHLAKLKRAGLVRAERHGKHMVHAIADPTVLQMVDLALATHRPPPHMPPPAAHEAMDDTPVGPAPPSGPAGGAVTGPLTPLRHPHCDG